MILPRIPLAALAAALLTTACGDTPVDPSTDAGETSSDAGTLDDAGVTDAGTGSDGGTDAGTDAGTDGGDMTLSWPMDTNNQAIINGATIGDGSAAAGSLRKDLIVSRADVPQGYEVLGAVAMRGSTTTTLTRIAVVVRNVSGQARCSLRIEPFIVESADGTDVSENGRFISGTMGITSSDNDTDTCLFEGDVGVVYLSLTAPYDVVARVDLTLGGTTTATRSDRQLKATAYSVSGNDVSVTLSNPGTESVQLQSMLLVVLDANGRPIYADIAVVNERPIIPGGGSTTVSERMSWDGEGNRLLVITKFDPPT